MSLFSAFGRAGLDMVSKLGEIVAPLPDEEEDDDGENLESSSVDATNQTYQQNSSLKAQQGDKSNEIFDDKLQDEKDIHSEVMYEDIDLNNSGTNLQLGSPFRSLVGDIRDSFLSSSLNIFSSEQEIVDTDTKNVEYQIQNQNNMNSDLSSGDELKGIEIIELANGNQMTYPIPFPPSNISNLTSVSAAMTTIAISDSISTSADHHLNNTNTSSGVTAYQKFLQATPPPPTPPISLSQQKHHVNSVIPHTVESSDRNVSTSGLNKFTAFVQATNGSVNTANKASNTLNAIIDSKISTDVTAPIGNFDEKTNKGMVVMHDIQ